MTSFCVSGSAGVAAKLLQWEGASQEVLRLARKRKLSEELTSTLPDIALQENNDLIEKLREVACLTHDALEILRVCVDQRGISQIELFPRGYKTNHKRYLETIRTLPRALLLIDLALWRKMSRKVKSAVIEKYKLPLSVSRKPLRSVLEATEEIRQGWMADSNFISGVFTGKTFLENVAGGRDETATDDDASQNDSESTETDVDPELKIFQMEIELSQVRRKQALASKEVISIIENYMSTNLTSDGNFEENVKSVPRLIDTSMTSLAKFDYHVKRLPQFLEGREESLDCCDQITPFVCPVTAGSRSLHDHHRLISYVRDKLTTSFHGKRHRLKELCAMTVAEEAVSEDKESSPSEPAAIEPKQRDSESSSDDLDGVNTGRRCGFSLDVVEKPDAQAIPVSKSPPCKMTRYATATCAEDLDTEKRMQEEALLLDTDEDRKLAHTYQSNVQSMRRMKSYEHLLFGQIERYEETLKRNVFELITMEAGKLREERITKARQDRTEQLQRFNAKKSRLEKEKSHLMTELHKRATEYANVKEAHQVYDLMARQMQAQQLVTAKEVEKHHLTNTKKRITLVFGKVRELLIRWNFPCQVDLAAFTLSRVVTTHEMIASAEGYALKLGSDLFPSQDVESLICEIWDDHERVEMHYRRLNLDSDELQNRLYVAAGLKATQQTGITRVSCEWLLEHLGDNNEDLTNPLCNQDGLSPRKTSRSMLSGYLGGRLSSDAGKAWKFVSSCQVPHAYSQLLPTGLKTPLLTQLLECSDIMFPQPVLGLPHAFDIKNVEKICEMISALEFSVERCIRYFKRSCAFDIDMEPHGKIRVLKSGSWGGAMQFHARLCQTRIAHLRSFYRQMMGLFDVCARLSKLGNFTQSECPLTDSYVTPLADFATNHVLKRCLVVFSETYNTLASVAENLRRIANLYKQSTTLAGISTTALRRGAANVVHYKDVHVQIENIERDDDFYILRMSMLLAVQVLLRVCFKGPDEALLCGTRERVAYMHMDELLSVLCTTVPDDIIMQLFLSTNKRHRSDEIDDATEENLAHDFIVNTDALCKAYSPTMCQHLLGGEFCAKMIQLVRKRNARLKKVARILSKCETNITSRSRSINLSTLLSSLDIAVHIWRRECAFLGIRNAAGFRKWQRQYTGVLNGVIAEDTRIMQGEENEFNTDHGAVMDCEMEDRTATMEEWEDWLTACEWELVVYNHMLSADSCSELIYILVQDSMSGTLSQIKASELQSLSISDEKENFIGSPLIHYYDFELRAVKQKLSAPWRLFDTVHRIVSAESVEEQTVEVKSEERGQEMESEVSEDVDLSVSSSQQSLSMESPMRMLSPSARGSPTPSVPESVVTNEFRANEIREEIASAIEPTPGLMIEPTPGSLIGPTRDLIIEPTPGLMIKSRRTQHGELDTPSIVQMLSEFGSIESALPPHLMETAQDLQSFLAEMSSSADRSDMRSKLGGFIIGLRKLHAQENESGNQAHLAEIQKALTTALDVCETLDSDASGDGGMHLTMDDLVSGEDMLLTSMTRHLDIVDPRDPGWSLELSEMLTDFSGCVRRKIVACTAASEEKVAWLRRARNECLRELNDDSLWVSLLYIKAESAASRMRDFTGRLEKMEGMSGLELMAAYYDEEVECNKELCSLVHLASTDPAGLEAVVNSSFWKRYAVVGSETKDVIRDADLKELLSYLRHETPDLHRLEKTSREAACRGFSKYVFYRGLCVKTELARKTDTESKPGVGQDRHTIARAIAGVVHPIITDFDPTEDILEGKINAMLEWELQSRQQFVDDMVANRDDTDEFYILEKTQLEQSKVDFTTRKFERIGSPMKEDHLNTHVDEGSLVSFPPSPIASPRVRFAFQDSDPEEFSPTSSDTACEREQELPGINIDADDFLPVSLLNQHHTRHSDARRRRMSPKKARKMAAKKEHDFESEARHLLWKCLSQWKNICCHRLRHARRSVANISAPTEWDGALLSPRRGKILRGWGCKFLSTTDAEDSDSSTESSTGSVCPRRSVVTLELRKNTAPKPEKNARVRRRKIPKNIGKCMPLLRTCELSPVRPVVAESLATPAVVCQEHKLIPRIPTPEIPVAWTHLRTMALNSERLEDFLIFRGIPRSVPKVAAISVSPVLDESPPAPEMLPRDRMSILARYGLDEVRLPSSGTSIVHKRDEALVPIYHGTRERCSLQADHISNQTLLEQDMLRNALLWEMRLEYLNDCFRRVPFNFLTQLDVVRDEGYSAYVQGEWGLPRGCIAPVRRTGANCLIDPQWEKWATYAPHPDDARAKARQAPVLPHVGLRDTDVPKLDYRKSIRITPFPLQPAGHLKPALDMRQPSPASFVGRLQVRTQDCNQAGFVFTQQLQNEYEEVAFADNDLVAGGNDSDATVDKALVEDNGDPKEVPPDTAVDPANPNTAPEVTSIASCAAEATVPHIATLANSAENRLPFIQAGDARSLESDNQRTAGWLPSAALAPVAGIRLTGDSVKRRRPSSRIRFNDDVEAKYGLPTQLPEQTPTNLLRPNSPVRLSSLRGNGLRDCAMVEGAARNSCTDTLAPATLSQGPDPHTTAAIPPAIPPVARGPQIFAHAARTVKPQRRRTHATLDLLPPAPNWVQDVVDICGAELSGIARGDDGAAQFLSQTINLASAQRKLRVTTASRIQQVGKWTVEHVRNQWPSQQCPSMQPRMDAMHRTPRRRPM